MPRLGSRSKSRLETCHPDLIKIMEEAINILDFTVLCGERDEDAQTEAFDSGRSKVQFPNSKHNSSPSRAVDIAPYPVDWNDLQRFHHLAGIIKGIAHEKGIKIKWGGDFNSFFDGPHFELLN